MASSARRFAELLTAGIAAIAARTAKPKSVIHDELGYALGRSGGSAIAYWGYGDGHLPRSQRDVELLAREIVHDGGLDRVWLAEFLTSAHYPHAAHLCDELFPASTMPGAGPLPLSSARSPVAAEPSLPPFVVQTADNHQEASVFVARRQKLAQLHGFLPRVLAGHGQVVFVTGEAGSGKSSLLREFTRQAQEAIPDLIVASGVCHAYTGMGDPYLPFRELLAMLTGDVEARWQAGTISRQQALRLWHVMPHAVAALLDAGPHLIDTFVPGPALLSRALAYRSPASVLTTRLQAHLARGYRPAPDQHHVLEEYARVLAALAATHPLLLLLDDLHWADVSSLSLLFYLGRSVADRRICIIGAYRPEEMALAWRGEPHPLHEISTELQRHFGDNQVKLDRVSAEGRHFVDALLDVEPNRLDEHFRQALFRHSGGHALFTVELLRDLQERGALVQDTTGQWTAQPSLDWRIMPARVEGVIAKRMGRLDPELRAILTVASIEGEDFAAEVVARVQALDARHVVQRLSSELDRRHRLVRAQGTHAVAERRLSRYQFRHHLFQAYLYHSLDAAERTYLHAAVGTALEEIYRDQKGELALLAAQLARHFEEAGRAGQASDYRLLAGQQAVKVSANQEAMGHFEAGLALLHTLPDTPARAQRELALQIALGVPVTASRGYAHPDVGPIYARARALCAQLGGTTQLFPALYGLWRMSAMQGKLRAAQMLSDEIMELALHANNPDQLVEAYRASGASASHGGNFSAARTLFEQGFALYDVQQHADHAYLYGHDPAVSCLGYLAHALWLLGYPDQAWQKCQEVLHLAQGLSHPFSLAHALVWDAAIFHQLRGEVREVQARAEAGVALATEHGFPHWNSMGTILLGWALAQQRQSESGIMQLRKGLADWQATGARSQVSYFLALLAESHGLAGEIETGLAILGEALAEVEQTEERWYEAEIHRLSGELHWKAGASATEVEALFQQALAVARQQQARSLELRAAMSLSQLWHEQGRRRQAHALLAEVHGWFTEGFDTPDLQKAEVLLNLYVAPVQ